MEKALKSTRFPVLLNMFIFCCCIFKNFLSNVQSKKEGSRMRFTGDKPLSDLPFYFYLSAFYFDVSTFYFYLFCFFLPFYSHLSSHRSKRNSGIIKIETPPRQTKFPLPDLVFYPFEVCICICIVYFLCQTSSFIRLRFTSSAPTS